MFFWLFVVDLRTWAIFVLCPIFALYEQFLYCFWPTWLNLHYLFLGYFVLLALFLERSLTAAMVNLCTKFEFSKVFHPELQAQMEKSWNRRTDKQNAMLNATLWTGPRARPCILEACVRHYWLDFFDGASFLEAMYNTKLQILNLVSSAGSDFVATSLDMLETGTPSNIVVAQLSGSQCDKAGHKAVTVHRVS